VKSDLAVTLMWQIIRGGECPGEDPGRNIRIPMPDYKFLPLVNKHTDR